MARLRTALVTATTLLAVIAAPNAATAAPANDDRHGLQKELDAVVDAGAIGALVEVRDGRDVWRATSGTAELGTTRSVPARGRFRAGSITKTFLATVALQLVDSGQLRLGDSVEKWLPGVVPHGDDITVRHLLNHTSGIPDVLPTLTLPPDPGFLDYRFRTWTASELIQRALADPPTSEHPGETFSYTNTGYLLLGQIVEKATGRPYATEIKRRIIRPLHLTETSVPGTFPRIRGPHLHGYAPIEYEDGAQLVDFTTMNPSLFGAAGEMISTAKDLNRFVDALLAGRLLPRRLLAAMKGPAVDGKAYGLGLAWRDTPCGVRVYGNDGDALSYQSWSFTAEDRSRQVTIALTPDFSADLDDVVDGFLDKAFCG